MGNLTAIIQADTTGFKRAVEDAKNILEKYTKAEDDATKALKEQNEIQSSSVKSYQRVVNTLNKVSSGAMSTTQAEKALTAQVKELQIQFANLSDKAKQSDFGQQLSKTADDAKKHLEDLRKQLDAVNDTQDKTKEVSDNSGSSFDKLTGFVGKYAGALAAATTALKVMKDAFLSTETGIDEWGRTVAAAETSYRVFLTTINNGDWRNFFRNLNDAIGGAIELYNTLDRLGSIKTNNQAAIALVEAELAKLRVAKQEGKDVDKQIAAAEAKLKRLRGQEVEQGKKAGKDTIIQAIKTQDNRVSDKDAAKMADELISKGQAAFDFYEKRIGELQAKAMDWDYIYDDMGNIVNKSLVFNEKLLSQADQARYHAYKAFIDAETPIGEGLKMYADAVKQETSSAQEEFKYNKWTGAGKGGTTTKTEVKVETKEAKTKLQELKDSLKELEKQRENIDIKAPDADKLIADINQQIKAKQDEIDTVEITLGIKEPKIETPKPVEVKIEPQLGSIGYLEKQLHDLSGEFDLAIDPASRAEISKQMKEIQKEIDALSMTKMDFFNDGVDGIESMVGAAESLNDTWNGIFSDWEDMDFGEKFFTMADAIFQTISAIEQFAQGVQTITTLINAMKVASNAATQQKIANNTAEQASNTALMATDTGLSVVEATKSGASLPFPANIAAIAAGVAAVIAAISMIGSFADGGIIKGGTTLGDMNIARVNGGEMILNGSQQSKLFNLLNGNGTVGDASTGGNVHFRIEGKDLVGVLNNYNKKTSRIL